MSQVYIMLGSDFVVYRDVCFDPAAVLEKQCVITR